jgi:hypothetical protein
LGVHHAILITIPSIRLSKPLFKLAVPYKYKQINASTLYTQKLKKQFRFIP